MNAAHFARLWGRLADVLAHRVTSTICIIDLVESRGGATWATVEMRKGARVCARRFMAAGDRMFEAQARAQLQRLAPASAGQLEGDDGNP